MYKATQIANFLVFLMIDSCDDLTNMKLNKLLYYAQGHYIKQKGVPLFEDDVEAWTHGPVVSSVYLKYKTFGEKPITEYDLTEANLIDDETKLFLLNIAREYGKYTAAGLRSMTHKPNSPWTKVHDGEVIPLSVISEYFSSKEKYISSLNLEFDDSDYVGTRDAQGIYVLPREWNDEAV